MKKYLIPLILQGQNMAWGYVEAENYLQAIELRKESFPAFEGRITVPTNADIKEALDKLCQAQNKVSEGHANVQVILNRTFFDLQNEIGNLYIVEDERASENIVI